MNDGFDAPPGNLRRRATAGLLKTGLSQGLRLLIQVASVIVLSRLLPPSEFGLAAMAAPIVGVAFLFQDLGLAQAVVQKATLTQPEVSTLFWLSCGLGVALAALLAVVAPLAGWFYNEPRVTALTAATGVSVLIGGLSSMQAALLARRMRFGAMTVIEVTAAGAGLATAIAVALPYRSVWALYAGSLVAALVAAGGYWMAAGWRPSRPRGIAGAGAAVSFGADVTGFNVATFFARNLDNVLIGRAWGEYPLGLYDRAYKLLLLPLQQINAPVAKVMLPVLARLAHDPERYRTVFLRTLSQMLIVTLPGIVFMVGSADVLVPVLLGRQWTDASPVFAVLGLASLLQAVNNPTGWLFMSQGRSRDYLCWGLFNAATCVVSFIVGLPYGPIGVAVAYAAGEFMRTPLLWWYVTRRGPICRQDVRRLAIPHAAAAAASMAAVAGVRAMPIASPLPFLAGALAASFLASGLMLMAFPHGRATIRRSVDLVLEACAVG